MAAAGIGFVQEYLLALYIQSVFSSFERCTALETRQSMRRHCVVILGGARRLDLELTCFHLFTSLDQLLPLQDHLLLLQELDRLRVGLLGEPLSGIGVPLFEEDSDDIRR